MAQNLAMPGNPRYQPKELVPYFGYDNFMGGLTEVEIANLQVLAEIGVMPQEDSVLLTPEVLGRLRAITTSEVDVVERKTKHDVRAVGTHRQGDHRTQAGQVDARTSHEL